MIELVIAAALQIAALTSDVIATPETAPATETTTVTTYTAAPGGTGNWDDNN